MSRMPRDSPISQCGRGSTASFFGASLRTTVLSFSSLPCGSRGPRRDLRECAGGASWGACHYPCSRVYDVVLVAFEGPDRYSFVGGLATRMTDLADALVDRGYHVHQLFVGDTKLPALEERA